MEFEKHIMGDICKIKYGKDHKKNEDGNIPVYGSGGLMRKCNKYLYEGESVLIPRKGSLNNVQYVEEKFWTVDTLFYTIIDKEKVIPKFLFNKIKNINFCNMDTGSAVPSMTATILNEIELEMPSIQNQKKILSILDAIDMKLKENNETNNNLLQISRNLFLNWYGEINTFDLIKLGKLCDIKYGKGLPTTKIEGNGFPVYGGNGIIGYYSECMYDKSQVLISCRGAASGKVVFTKEHCFVTNNSLVLECDDKYHFYIKELSLANPYYGYATGSAQPQITIENIKGIEIKIPSDDNLNMLNNLLSPLEQKYFEIENENKNLSQLRATLLPKLMNGEIDLENINL